MCVCVHRGLERELECIVGVYIQCCVKVHTSEKKGDIGSEREERVRGSKRMGESERRRVLGSISIIFLRFDRHRKYTHTHIQLL